MLQCVVAKMEKFQSNNKSCVKIQLCSLKFSIKFKLFHSKTLCYGKFPSVPVPNTVHRLSQWHLTCTHSYAYCTAEKLRTWRTTACHQEDCEELNCEIVIHYMAGPNIILHFAETWPWEETAPNSPPSNGVLSNRIDISNRGLQTNCWVVFFHFLPLSLWLMLAEGSMCTHLRSALPPSQNNSSMRSDVRTYVVTGWQVCWGPTMSRSNGLGNVATQRWWSGFQLSQMMSKNTGEQNKDQNTLPSRRQAENKKLHTFWGVGIYPLLAETNASPQPSSFTSSP